MAIDKKTVEYVAALARVALSPEELEKLSSQLKDILGFIDKLKQADISKVNPTSHILPIYNVLREDEIKESLPVEKVVKSAPERQGNFFVVPKVIE